jgi:1-aminocyclopropane-1-carboxylate deaminase/D-cysteine desulfhydrase-like pyridoxal-dependent ACC family enzyme
MRELELFKKYPRLKKKFSRISLGNYPTRVHKLKEISKLLDIRELWIKRDDETSELLGGSKVRKLEFILGQAKAKNKDILFVPGVLGSNYVLSTCFWALRYNMEVIAILSPRPFISLDSDWVSFIRQLGTKIIYVPSLLGLMNGYIFSWLRYRRGLLLPLGGSSPLGSLGYVEAALEFCEQIRKRELSWPEVIYLPVGSGGTIAGLLAGFMLEQSLPQVVGVRVVPGFLSSYFRISRLLSKILDILEEERSKENLRTRLYLRDGFMGKGYAYPTREASYAKQLVKELEGVILDDIYTAKAFSALISDAKEGRLRKKRVLFWHTFFNFPRVS